MTEQLPPTTNPAPMPATRLAEIRREVAPDFGTVAELVAEIDRLAGVNEAHIRSAVRASQEHQALEELARDRLSRIADLQARCEEVLVVRWDRTVIHPDADPTDDTIVCCLTDDGQPVALMLDDEHREALGLTLVDPNAEQDGGSGDDGEDVDR